MSKAGKGAVRLPKILVLRGDLCARPPLCTQALARQRTARRDWRALVVGASAAQTVARGMLGRAAVALLRKQITQLEAVARGMLCRHRSACFWPFPCIHQACPAADLFFLFRFRVQGPRRFWVPARTLANPIAR